MPKHLGEKSKRIAQAAEQEAAILEALKVAKADEIEPLAAQLVEIRSQKKTVRTLPEDEFVCAWHRDGGSKKGEFKGKARVVFEVTAVFKYDDESEPIIEERFRDRPMYLVGCPVCDGKLKLVEHLME